MINRRYRKEKAGDIPCWLCALGHRPHKRRVAEEEEVKP